MEIFCYARVSTIEQCLPGTASIETQLKRCRAIAEFRNGDHPIEYRDDGVSGSVPLRERKAGGRMIAQAIDGDVIIAAKMDRLFRSAVDALKTAEELKKRGIDLILADLGVDPVTANGVGKFFFGIMAQVAEFERDRLRERLAEGRLAKRLRGGHLGGAQAPYGFRIERDESIADGRARMRASRLVPIEDEQAIIMIASDLVEKCGANGACRELTKRGIMSRSGKPFQAVQVLRMIDIGAWASRLNN